MSLVSSPSSSVPSLRLLRAVPPRLRRVLADDTGAATAEYAIVIMAAVGFAGLLLAVVRSPEVKGMLMDLVRQALSVG
ncbi:DUF4244 domain-containing protein [Frondihabitans cladoniiphilus]|uniref:DUF4244 domain-containing protein n=1 Tax=Frondihabitans cladoniiphilus TaxID=715785 RepID=A0ABP8VZE7_9MICO